MARIARSARGAKVDFDLLAIKSQLQATPAPVGVDKRRKFIDERDGVRRDSQIIYPDSVPAMELSNSGIEESEAAELVTG